MSALVRAGVAFMALVLCNTHGELTPLERGMHALKSGMSVRGYGEKVGRSAGPTVARQSCGS